jgi:recombination protein RecR
MPSILPKALLHLIEELGKLPGVGPRTAERYAYDLLRRDPMIATRLASAITDLHGNVGYCPKTFALIEKDQKISPLYSDPERDKTVIAVVEEPLDVVALERTGQFKGTYHVLGGVISPIDGIGPEQLHITELLQRVNEDKVKELILATNASVEGESTALYLQKQIGEQAPKVKITRLARGLPVGVDLEYADQITLSHALEGRQKI